MPERIGIVSIGKERQKQDSNKLQSGILEFCFATQNGPQRQATYFALGRLPFDREHSF